MKGDETIFYSLMHDEARAELQSAVLRSTICTYPFSRFKSLQGNHALMIQKNYERNLAVAMLTSYLKHVNIDFRTADNAQFWKPNLPDFQMEEGQPWVVMNKTMRGNSKLGGAEFVFLPALIPNRFDGDRWSQKGIDNGELNHFVFTFLRQKSDYSNQNFPIKLSQGVLNFLGDLSAKYQSIDLQKAPYTLDWFWNQVETLGGLTQNIEVPELELVICGMADSNSFSFFSNTDGYSEFGYALYTGRWYEVVAGGELNFRNGALQTHFKNATCPMAALPSFLSAIRNKAVGESR